jgi:hypothetical protein
VILVVTRSEPPPEPASGRAKLRWMLGWIVLPLAVVGGLFSLGVHVGARHPDMALSRLLLWIFDAEPGVSVAPRAQPAPRSTPRSTPREIDLTGEWVVGNYVVDVQPPAGAVLQSYGRRGGLTMTIGRTTGPDDRVSEITVIGSCDGDLDPDNHDDADCDDASLRATIQAEPEAGMARWSSSGAQLEWVSRLTELRHNVWWYHYRGTDEFGNPVDLVEVTALDSRAHSFSSCTAKIFERDRARLDELTEYCKNLSWRVVGTDEPPTEARFDGRYAIEGFELHIPKPPPGFVFDDHTPGFMVYFRGIETDSVFLVCGHACVRSWLDARHPLERFAANRWRTRKQSSNYVRGEVVAARSGAEASIVCEYRLKKGDQSRADEFEELCVELLADY